MGGDARWTAAAIMMHGGGEIAKDSGSSDGQWQRNGWWDGKAVTTGIGAALSQWTAQWAAFDCHQRKSGAMEGDTKWAAAVFAIYSGGEVVVDVGSGDGRQRRNGRRDGEGIAMGDGTVVV
jgi:hypothetical protein